MTIRRRVAAAAMLTGLAVGGAAPAWADTVFSGHYTATDTLSGGNPATFSYDVTPCGDGCVRMAIESGLTYTAHLINGQWQWDETDNSVTCNDGTNVLAAADSHNAIDATTLRGTSLVTYKKAACGYDNSGQTYTHTLVLTKAPSSSSPEH